MTLKEKFKNWLNTNPRLQIREAQLETIADNYAIEFAEWIVQNCNHSKLKFLDYKELLEQFKKEKGWI